MKKRPTAFRAAARRTIVFTFVCWFCAMFLLTWAVAADMDMKMRNYARGYMSGTIDREQLFGNDEYPATMPGDMEVNTLHSIPYQYGFPTVEQLIPIVGRQTPSSYGSDDWFWGNWDLLYGYEPAFIYYDENGNIYAKSGSFFTFEYNFVRNGPTSPGRAYLDMNVVDGALDNRLDERGVFYSHYFDFLRLKGYFRGNEFVPVTIDSQIPNSQGHWENLLTLNDDGSVPLVTIIGRNVKTFYYEEVPVRAKGEKFDSLVDLLVESYQSNEYYTKSNLFDTVLVHHSGQRSDVYGNFGCSMALRYHPVQYSMLRLLAVYLVSLTAVAVWSALYLRKLRKSLIDPIAYIAYAIDHGTTLKPTAQWEELRTLETYFADSRTYASETNAELQQLRTALDYARSAEENRRQLVSNITHELKTPLAVIHSYAECLQENVVPEKREQYLSVILEETRHMDAMVLQMLDLSRLEAGKVRLASDTVSLEQLTRQIFDRFAIMIEEKQLRVHWVVPTETLIAADEGRISQAVTNLVSNAVKYTPIGGEITVKIFVKDQTVYFYISNTATHLSEETLEKVWDSFYRADPSRTEPGTGLGLALVKSIIQLHGGQCFVRNTSTRYETKTETGVEFGFTIPLP